MDPLSDIVSLLKPRVDGAEGLDFGGEWSVQFPEYNGMRCYAVVSGECMLLVDGVGEAVCLKTGDCILLPQGRPFRLASDRNLAPTLSHRYATPGAMQIWGGGGCCFVAGGHFVLLNDHARILLGGLPPVMHIRDETHRSALRLALDGMRGELKAQLPGAHLIAQHLAHIIMIHALRLHVAGAEGGGVGWLSALADRQLSGAISAVHKDPSFRWTLQALAACCAMSRSGFALRFKKLAGISPMGYVARWRMLLASDRLANSNASISALARSLGYDTESAFSTAFKRLMGCSPRQYRRGQSTPKGALRDADIRDD